jgi:IS30 family transposase
MPKFTLSDRRLLGRLLQDGMSHSQIAKSIGKSKSSISDELRRNSESGQYDPETAHAKAARRHLNRIKRTKLEISEGLRNYVVEKIRLDWSPEQIAGELRRLAGKRTVISHEIIYQFIYSEAGRKLKLWLHLRHRKKPERVHHGTRKRRLIIPERVSIRDRPIHINLRQDFGHHEGDLMIFSNGSALAVFVERLTRKTVAILLPNKSSREMELAMHELISSSGQTNVKSITFDNGTENVCHARVRADYEYSFQTYFCDAYCSWQKGTVENTNKLLRQYLPRDIAPEKLTQDFIDEVVQLLNSRPRKCLGYLTPDDKFKNCSV